MTQLHLPELPESFPDLSDTDFDRIRGILSLPDLHPRAIDDDRYRFVSTTCMTCLGRGEFRFWLPRSTTEVGEYLCPCPDQWRMRAMMTASGLKDDHQEWRWHDVEGHEDGLSFVFDGYLLDPADTVRRGRSMFLWGPTQSGKTIFSVLALKKFLQHGFSGYYTTLADLVVRLTDGWKDEGASDLYDRIVQRSDVLVVDSIGQETGSKEEFVARVLGDVMRYRDGMARSTILASGLSPRALSDKWPEYADMFSDPDRTLGLAGNWRQRVSTTKDAEQAGGLRRPATFT